MSDLRIDYLDLDELPEATRNARRHDLDAIAGAYRRLGFTRPGLIDERTGRLVAGHGRRLALRRDLERGGKPPAGIHQTAGGWAMPVVRGWASKNDAEADAAALADNKVGESGGYDDAILFDILGDLAGDAPDLMRAAHFDSADLDRLLESVSTPTDLPPALGEVDHDLSPFDAPRESRADEQWTAGGDPDEGSSREEDGPGPLDVEPAWRTIEPLRARYHDGTPARADAIAAWLRPHAKTVHVDHTLAIAFDTVDGTEYLPPGKWVTRYRGKLTVMSRDEMAEEFVPANEPARRADRDAKPVKAAKAKVPTAAELLRNGTGVLLGHVGPSGLTVGDVGDTAHRD